MNPDDVKDCLYDLSNKKCEGFDRIPVCCIYDACAVLLRPLSLLFDKIYKTSSIPEQWKISKIMYYQLALSLHKTLNFDECDLSFELITV